MPDMLGTGLSSLRALQRALDTTAHNIANVSTPGYSRQRVEFQTRQPSVFGASWIGNGVDVSQVRRIYDQFLTAQARDSSGNLARLDAFATQAERLDNMLGDTTNGLSTSLQSYTDALSEVSSTPSSNSARQVLLSQGRALAQRLQDYDKRLREMSADIDTRFAGEAREVTLLAQGIARLNGEITVGTQNTGQAPNDLLDERDRLIDQIAGKVSVTTVAEGVGTVNVFIGNGQPLVLGTTSSEITTVTDPFDPERTPGQRPASRGHGSQWRARRRFFQRRRCRHLGCHHQHRHRRVDGDAHQHRRHHGRRLHFVEHRQRLYAAPPG
jgi:flagellar hook-associated protein 1 FlgK